MNRRAISPLIAILLLIAITVAAIVVTYMFLTGFFEAGVAAPGVARGSIMVENASAGKSLDKRELRGYWSLDEGSGTTAADGSGNGNDGTLAGSTLPQWDPNGASKYCLDFFGPGGSATNSSRVEVSDSASLDISGTELTMEAWVYYESSNPPVSSVDIILNKERSYEFAVGSDRHVRWAIETTGVGTWYWVDSGVLVDPDAWTHIVIVYNGSDVRVYKNGELASTPYSYSGTVEPSNNPLGIGARYSGGNWNYGFPGKIDEVAVYARVLTPEEIKEHYNNGGPYINSVVLSVRNTGSTTLTITDVYLNSPSGAKEHFDKSSLAFSGNGVLEPGEVEQVYIRPTMFAIEVGKRYTGSVICEGGVKTTFEVYA